MRIKRILTDTIIIIAITCVIIAVIELVVRAAFPEMKDYRKSSRSTVFQYNEKYLVSLKPNHVQHHTVKKENGGGTVIWQTNALGFRGEEIDPKNRPRIIVYGDSNVLARFSQDKDTYPSVLQKILRSNGENAQVINAGIAGAGPDQSLIRLADDFDLVKPDMVIFHIFADNDYGDIIKNRLYKISSNDELIKTGFPSTVDEKFTELGPKVSDLFRGLYLQGAVNYLLSKRKETKENALSKQVKTESTLNELEQAAKLGYSIYKSNQPRQLTHFSDLYDIDIAADPQSESAQVKIKLMEKVLLAANKFCTEKNVRFIVIVQPSMLDLTMSPYYIGYQDLAKRYKNYKPTNLTDPLKQICTKHNLSCVHLIDSYRQNDPDTLYLGDGHWNTKGQLLAAEETSKKIMQLQVASTTLTK